MAVLNDREIEERIRKGNLITGEYDIKLVTPNGYDVRAESIRVSGMERKDGADIPSRNQFFVSTMETIDLPADISAQIWIRSSYARKGIIGSFGFIDAGFRGQLTLSFFNSSDESLHISRGERIAQVVFMIMTSPAERDYSMRSGNYQNSSGIKLS
ncbi:MAG: dCTP deaminase [Candidatus Thermoplasmatota archaeon]|nr:dCTP deaminase [Candidatus Thermoplasmatota archaeon]